MVGNAVPPETARVKSSSSSSYRMVLKIVGVMFVVGIAVGACSLGMALPLALLKLATG